MIIFFVCKGKNKPPAKKNQPLLEDPSVDFRCFFLIKGA